jgi:hypothetical protein
MPVKRRAEKRRLDPELHRDIWTSVLESGRDFFRELRSIGVALMNMAGPIGMRLPLPGKSLASTSPQPAPPTCRKPGASGNSAAHGRLTMPIKRRLDKSRRLDDYRWQQLLEGPDATLFAGIGYLAGLSGGMFDRMCAEEQAIVLAAMRKDWAIHGPALMEWWNAGEADRER